MGQEFGDFGLGILGRHRIGETRRYSGQRLVQAQRLVSVKAAEDQ